MTIIAVALVTTKQLIQSVHQFDETDLKEFDFESKFASSILDGIEPIVEADEGLTNCMVSALNRDDFDLCVRIRNWIYRHLGVDTPNEVKVSTPALS